MSNQEIVQALEEYTQMERRLVQLSQQKTKLQKEIKLFQIPREAPKPQRPSIFRTFISDLWLSFFLASVVLVLIGKVIPEIWNVGLLWLLLLVMTAISCVITPIHYKRKDSEACAKYVTDGMRYKEWEEGKQRKLPVLQKQLNQVINEGGNLYQKFQRAKLRTILHSDYLPYSEVIMGYFKRGRVKSLSEAVNLLEQELLEHRRDLKTATYREEMLRQARTQTLAAEEAAEQGRQAAEAAEEAAFWGAAATFVAASIRQKDDSGDYHVV